jgi:hypothetical protein
MQSICGYAGGAAGMPVKELRGIFPAFAASKRNITSPIDLNYNCVSWAIKDTNNWWEPYGMIIPPPPPVYHWPDNLPQDLLPQTFVKFFQGYGFEVTQDSQREVGIEKLAIYVREGEFQHVARQLPNGRWTSKIGKQEDIEHNLRDLESDNPFGYGRASIFMKRDCPQR